MDENKKINEGKLAEVSGGVPDKGVAGHCYFSPVNPVSLKTLSKGGVAALCARPRHKDCMECRCFSSLECKNRYHMLDKVEADGFSYLAPKSERGHNLSEIRIYVGKQ